MPNYNMSTRQRVADIRGGLRVDRAAATHSGAQTAYFTVSGEIMLIGLVGKVTVASGANACKWTATPTAGTARDMCAQLDIDPALVGDLLGISGVLATAMTYGGAVVGMMQPQFITSGTLDFTSAAADGATSWSLLYVPISDGASVVAA